MARTLILIISLLCTGLTHGQESMRMMHYNLLFYGNPFACDENNNNTNDKDENLKQILDYIQPDIVTVNELSSDELYADRILNEVLNTNGIISWQRANSTNTSWDSGIVNMLYYNGDKYTLYDQVFSTQAPNGTSLTRGIDMYMMYENISALSQDTVFFNVLVAHLHSSNEDMRLAQCQAAMELTNNNDVTNVIFSGDFNVDDSNEDSFQELINYDNPNRRLFDAADALGNWHDNSTFSHLHSQSTHQNGSGCASGGGLDDRFDFTLVSEGLLNEDNDITLQESSYRVLGNDGNNFGQALHTSNNDDVPTNIAIALYSTSDHLPIITDYSFEFTVSITENARLFPMQLWIDSHQFLNVKWADRDLYHLQLFDLQGGLIDSWSIEGNSNVHDISHLSPSHYILSCIRNIDAKRTYQKFTIFR